MMKRILSILLCLTTGWICAQAQTKYRVGSFKGDVQYKQRGSAPSWKTVELDLILEAPDSISLAEGSMIRIIDTERNRIYNSRGAVKEPVCHLGSCPGASLQLVHLKTALPHGS